MGNNVFRARSGSTNADAPSLYGRSGSRKYLTEAERERVLALVVAEQPDRQLFILVLMWSGARVSEVLSLTRTSFDLSRGLVAIRTLKRRRLHVREVPLPEPLMDALNRRFELDKTGAISLRLWPWHRTTAWRVVKRIMSAACVEGLAASPRGFRHGFGVGAVQSGIPLSMVQRWLGHARLTTTAIYTEASGPEERLLATRLWQRSSCMPDAGQPIVQR